jgi:hypothetical protein
MMPRISKKALPNAVFVPRSLLVINNRPWVVFAVAVSACGGIGL